MKLAIAILGWSLFSATEGVLTLFTPHPNAQLLTSMQDDTPPVAIPVGTLPEPTGSLWTERSESLFEDFKARQVGDLLTIVVVENTTASARADTSVKKSESASTQAGVGPLLNFFWPELSAGGKTDSSAQGSTTRTGTLTTRLTVVVVETFPNGVLRVEGRRTLKINEETQTVVFSGLVRIRDIRSDNTVPSTAIANAEVYFEGKGVVGTRQREGIITRLFKFLF